MFSPGTSAGGLERYLDTTIKQLLDKKIEVHLVTVAYDKQSVEKKDGLIVHRLKSMNPNIRNKNKGAQRFFKYVKNLVVKEKIDVISAENFYRGIHPSYAFAINLVSMETNVPVVLRMHGHTDRVLEQSLVRDLFWDKILSVSKNVSSFSYNFGTAVDRLSTVYPPVNIESFRPDLGKDWLRSRIDIGMNDLLVMHASRITGSRKNDYLVLKGVPTLIKAFSIFSQHHKNAKLLISTAKPPASWNNYFEKAVKKIYELAELEGIRDKIIVKSFSLDEMPHVYNGADIFVMASHMESFGLVYAEAMACEIPVIGTSVGGIPEIIDNGKTGYLIGVEDHVELAKKLDLLAVNESRRKSMGKKGRKVIEKRFSAKKILDKYVGILESIVANKMKKTFVKSKHVKKNNKAMGGLIN